MAVKFGRQQLDTLLLMAMALLVAMGLAAGVTYYLADKGLSRPEVQALWLQQPRPLAPVVLWDDQQQPFGTAQLQGHWTLLFMGYTSCPDICPMTLTDLAQAMPTLAREDLQVVMLSVDPERDDISTLHRYVNFFDPTFKAVTGEHSALHPFSQSLGLVYAMVTPEPTQASQYWVDHSADIVLINPDGQLEAVFRPTHPPFDPLNPQIPTVSMAQLALELPLIIGHRG